MVAVDETLTNPKPLEHVDQIKAELAPPGFSPAEVLPDLKETSGPSPPTGRVVTARSVTRASDTDALGHINNAKYLYLAVEASPKRTSY